MGKTTFALKNDLGINKINTRTTVQIINMINPCIALN